MLFMVIEHFKDGAIDGIGQRFREKGSMLPAGVVYQASWIDPASSRCWQITEAPDRKSQDPWIAEWADLVDFEVVAVERSEEFWKPGVI